MSTSTSNTHYRVHRLTQSVSEAIRTGQWDAYHFEELALDVVRLQSEHLPGYVHLFERASLTPNTLTRWQDAPPIPTAAFKHQRLSLLPAETVFRSSGTTQGVDQRSAHHHANLDLYRLVLSKTFPSAVIGQTLEQAQKRPVLSLIAPLSLATDSSLSFMTDWVLRNCGDSNSIYAFDDNGKLDLVRAVAWLEEVGRERPEDRESAPVVLTTGLALWTLLEELNRLPTKPRWPTKTIVMETGGFKTRRFDLSREQLLDGFESATGLSRKRIVREYGMTELTSQAYASDLHHRDSEWFEVPAWVRVRALDPVTMQALPPRTASSEGSAGLLAFLDLGNVASAASILTEDLGIVAENGRSFRLLGRATNAELRGCSLATEALLP